jgi:hypothetical protein
MSAVLAAKLLTLLTLAEVWLKMGAYCADDLVRAHKDMRYLLDFPPDGVELEVGRLLRQAEIWRQKQRHEEVARCHADMRALLESVEA